MRKKSFGFVLILFFFNSDLNMALQKLLMEDRANHRLLFWWAFYGTIDTGKDTGEIQMINMLFNHLGFLCLQGDNSMKCKQRQGADADCLSAVYRAISGWGCWKAQQLLVPLCPCTAPCQRVPKHRAGAIHYTRLGNHSLHREGRIQMAF